MKQGQAVGDWVVDIMIYSGVAMLAVGVWRYSPPLSLIVMGGALAAGGITLAVLRARRAGRRQP